MSTITYPVRVEARFDDHLSRWLWAVKWLLVLPHAVVLAFLWLGFVLASIAAFATILLTGRYPAGLFAYNLGVLRWTWRVQYYTYGALATDRYPPFTLGDVEDYPARLEIDQPGPLSRGLVLVKWWLLALPHYLVIGAFLGGGWAMWHLGGLVGVLALVAAGFLAVTGHYPRPVYDFLLGMNRWVLRVVAYAALMTDAYPPFRLDMGEHEPGAIRTEPLRGSPSTSGAERRPQ